MGFIPIVGAVLADTVYANGTLRAKNVEAKFPEVTPATTEVQATGPLELALWSFIENMELSITRIGVDEGLSGMTTPKPMRIEFRFVQDVVQADGARTEVGCKAFFTATPKSFPSIEVKPGEAIETELPYGVTRYQLFQAGKEVLLVDKLASIVRINGEDLASRVQKLL